MPNLEFRFSHPKLGDLSIAAAIPAPDFEDAAAFRAPSAGHLEILASSLLERPISIARTFADLGLADRKALDAENYQEAFADVKIVSVREISDVPLGEITVGLVDEQPFTAQASNYAMAQLLGALEREVVGRPLVTLSLGDLPSRLSAHFSTLKPWDDKHKRKVLARVSLQDWRVEDGSTEDLTPDQRVPWEVTLEEGSWGPSIKFVHPTGQEHEIATEINAGCVVAHAYLGNSDEHFATVKMNADTMMASLDSASGNAALYATTGKGPHGSIWEKQRDFFDLHQFGDHPNNDIGPAEETAPAPR